MNNNGSKKRYNEEDVREIIINVEKYNKCINFAKKKIINCSIKAGCASIVSIYQIFNGITDENYRVLKLVLGAVWALASILNIQELKHNIEDKKTFEMSHDNYIKQYDVELKHHVELKHPKRLLKRNE